MKEYIKRIGFGRRKIDEVCGTLHKNLDTCIGILKTDVKSLETSRVEIKSRLSALEPQVQEHREDISGMRKLMMATLVTAITILCTLVSGLGFLIIKHYTEGG